MRAQDVQEAPGRSAFRPAALAAALASIWALSVTPAWPGAAPPPARTAGGERLVVSDDLGRPLAGPVQVCFVLDLATDCVDLAPPARSVGLRPARLLRVEGPGYGPVIVERRALAPDEEGEVTLQVPRKARLEVAGGGDAPLGVALFPVRDPDFDRPAYRYDLAPSSGITAVAVPAGDYVLALEARGAAPDLHRLAAPPGSVRRVRYRPSAGGSLIVRALAGPDGGPVAGAEVSAIRPRPAHPSARARSEQGAAEAPEPPPPAAHDAETGEDGLALLSGLEEALLDVSLAHPDFVTASLPGIAIASGALEHREVELHPGGSVEARIEVDGEPAREWRCRLLDRSSPLAGDRDAPHPSELASAAAGEDGLCRLERLPEGGYWLRVTAPDEGGGAAEREIRIVDGETTRLDLDLSPIPVEGRVTRGSEPVAGYGVAAYRLSEGGSTLLVESVAETSTDDDGRFRLTLWDTGRYSVHLAGPDGAPVASKTVEVTGGSEEVDFQLASGDLFGRVVDQDGQPLEGAQVQAVVREAESVSFRSGLSGEDGAFRFPLEATNGTAELSARLEGYRPSPKVELRLAAGAPPPPSTLVLTRGELLRGRLVAASGAPVARATILAYPPELPASRPGAALSGRAASAADGSFEILPAEGPRTRLFATGPACPLTSSVVPSASEEPVLLTCPAGAGTLVLHFEDASGRPVGGEAVILRTVDAVFPLSVLGSHLFGLGLGPVAGASGTLTVPGLAPGRYDVYRQSLTDAAAVAQGRPDGYVGSVDVAPGGVAELEVRVAEPP